MNRLIRFSLGLLFLSCVAAQAAGTEYRLENSSLSRTLTVKDGHVYTSEIQNKRADRTLTPLGSDEFRLRISQGTDTTGTDEILTSADFTCTDVQTYATNPATRGIVFTLNHPAHEMGIKMHYEIKDDDFYMRKYLEITSAKTVTLERIDVEAMSFDDAFQPCTHTQITARAKSEWRPGLGQPLYTTNSATFWGIEFPAAYNLVNETAMSCGYLWGREIGPGTVYRTYPAVVGAGDDPEFIGDAFLEYIDRIRIRPFRLQVQYNCWFEYKRNVTREKFAESVETIDSELVRKRGVPPFSAYVVDDGWQILEPGAEDITKQAWPVNDKFDKDFATTLATVHSKNSELGLWLSPASMFGANHMAGTYETLGFETLGLKAKQMSMCGPKYMDLLEDRLLELTRQGISFFKFDGIFGHTNVRTFELQGRGCPAMPQLIPKDFSADDERLNDPKYDELKLYYLTAGTERLMQIFLKMHAVNPKVYLTLSNGAYLSPWWLQYGDAVWMINAGDQGGAGTSGLLSYRDSIYYQIWKEEGVQFPMCALFNHEPKQMGSAEDPADFRQYLYMCLSRGTGLVEIYLKGVRKLRDTDWDVWAEGLKWAHRFSPVFKYVHMHGGNPAQQEVYGYRAWNREMGYVSLHNPSDQEKSYAFTLDRTFGVPADAVYQTATPLGEVMGMPASVRSGDEITVVLKPYDVRVIEFTK